MPEFNNLTPRSDGRHSFLYWLVIPLLLLWFTASYLIGSFSDRPAWLETSSTNIQSQSVIPHVQAFSPLPQSQTGYITLWFDDAWLSQYIVAFRIMQDYNFPGTIAVPTSAVETKDYVNWAQLQRLQESGWEITNHSDAHNCQMQNWSADAVRREFYISRQALWKHYLSSDILVTPCGVDSQTMRNEAEKFFLAYRTVDPGVNNLTDLNLYKLKVRNLDYQTTEDNIKKWINEAKQANHWVILVFHRLGGINAGTEADRYDMSESEFKSVMDYINQQQIPVVTPSQIISAYYK